MSKPINIYFCGSIRGGRQDVSYYATIVEHLRSRGHVLTEVIADPTLTKEDRIPIGKDKELHDRNMCWFEDSDVIIAEVTVASLGVGYELGRAVAMKKPTLCLFRPDNQEQRRLSAMVKGAESPLFVNKEYTEVSEALIHMDDFLRELKFL